MAAGFVPSIQEKKNFTISELFIDCENGIGSTITKNKYWGKLKIYQPQCQPLPHVIFHSRFVSSFIKTAAGLTGQLVGQIAKIKGMRVVGLPDPMRTLLFF
ncbi:hypothetical protein RhiirC2_718415 [Rhizophagus irregularis]|uniref:Uncharacterized protein n=1 Tax=Rhizophagus irregularis TaxID=588596 RepID=A0A2N1MIH6_9GLOM|nr:hypothetical protein RhiirC2_718415 [Rhizophagus irregularis]